MDLQLTPPAAAAADESKEAEVKDEADFEMESAEGAAAAASSSAATAAASSSAAAAAPPLASVLVIPPPPCVGCEVCPRRCEDPERRG
jgi:hypothetical protein